MRKGKILLAVFWVFGFSAGIFAQFIPPTGSYIDPDTEPKKEKPKKEEIKIPEVKKTRETVENLSAELVDPVNRIVRITFLASDITDDYIIARSNEPISSMQKLLEAKSIAVVPASVQIYSDSPSDPGNYYYAVISKESIKKKNAKFILNMNYTGNPVSAGITQSIKENSIFPAQITLLFAQAIKDGSVRLSWRGIEDKTVSYIVYRGTEAPLSNSSLIARSTMLAVITDRAEFYEDKSIPSPGNYYYAVATRSVSGSEDQNLNEAQSYLLNSVHISSREVPITRSIRAYLKRVVPASGEKKAAADIAVEWRDVNDSRAAGFRYQIYRSNAPILNRDNLANLQRTSEVDAGMEYFLDTVAEPGKYYYAIVSVSPDGVRSEVLRTALNTTESRIEITPELLSAEIETKSIPEVKTDEKIPPVDVKPPETVKEESPAEFFSGFGAFSREKTILLNWKTASALQTAQGGRIRVYRFTEPPVLLADIVKGTLVATYGPDQILHEDKPKAEGLYYYAILFETPQGMYPRSMKQGENVIGPIPFTQEKKSAPVETKENDEISVEQEDKPVEKRPAIESQKIIKEPYKPTLVLIEEPDLEEPPAEKKPVEKKKEKKASPPAINDVIRSTYFEGRFRETLLGLAPYRKDADASVRAKAWMYSGMALYNVGEYDKALNVFSDPLVMQAYPDHSRKWYRKTLNNIK